MRVRAVIPELIYASIGAPLLAFAAPAGLESMPQVLRLEAPLDGSSIYQNANDPESLLVCVEGPDDQRLLQPLVPILHDDLSASFAIGSKMYASLALTPALAYFRDGFSPVWSGETHFGMPVIDGLLQVENYAYSGETHFGLILDGEGRVWWSRTHSGDMYFGRRVADKTFDWRSAAPMGARPLVPAGAAVVDSDIHGCRAAASNLIEIALSL